MAIIYLIGGLYVTLMLYYGLGLLKQFASTSRLRLSEKQALFTLIIPYRNEGSNLHKLVESIEQNQLELKENNIHCVFIDDHSEDNSTSILSLALAQKSFTYSIQVSNGEGKKAAITTGVNLAKTEWIVTVDADCKLPPLWAKEVGKFLIQTEAQLVAMPIALEPQNGLFNQLQSIESAALVSMSAGALAMGVPLSANGANFAFTKKLFEQLDGYDAEKNIASGDDEFLLKRAFELSPKNTVYFMKKEVCVETETCKNMASLIQQRVRWASKISWNKMNFRQLLIWVPSIFMAMLTAFFVLSIFGIAKPIFGYLMLCKWLGDFILFSQFASFFHFSIKQIGMLILMPFYQILYMIPTLISLFYGNMEWKNRNYGRNR
jgi:glycosyltransferase involved in cell wall biosynthesis